jgi:RNA polymerase sigma factor (sigma-70 family)
MCASRCPPCQSQVQNDVELAALLAATALGDQAAFVRLHRIATPRLFGWAHRFRSQRDSADDIVQESLIAIWRQAGHYDGALGSPLSWMAAIVRHKAVDAFRRGHCSARSIALRDCSWFDGTATARSPCDAIELRQGSAALLRRMGRLAGAQRSAIAMVYLSEPSHAEAALQLGVPLGTVKTWVRRGLVSLRAMP